jgi:hypothetical protein
VPVIPRPLVPVMPLTSESEVSAGAG